MSALLLGASNYISQAPLRGRVTANKHQIRISIWNPQLPRPPDPILWVLVSLRLRVRASLEDKYSDPCCGHHLWSSGATHAYC